MNNEVMKCLHSLKAFHYSGFSYCKTDGLPERFDIVHIPPHCQIPAKRFQRNCCKSAIINQQKFEECTDHSRISRKSNSHVFVPLNLTIDFQLKVVVVHFLVCRHHGAAFRVDTSTRCCNTPLGYPASIINVWKGKL